MSTAAALLELLRINSDINYYTQQQIYYSQKEEAMAAKVTKYQKYEEEWEKAYDKVMDADSEKPVEFNNQTFVSGNTYEAERYANMKVRQRNEEVYLDCCDKDMEYDSLKEMYNTYLEKARAEKDSVKTLVSESAQDTHGISQ